MPRRGTGSNEHLDHFGVDHRATRCDLADRFDQRCGVTHTLLEQVRPSGSAAIEERQGVLRVHELASAPRRLCPGACHAARGRHGSPRPSRSAAYGCRSARHRGARPRSPARGCRSPRRPQRRRRPSRLPEAVELPPARGSCPLPRRRVRATRRRIGACRPPRQLPAGSASPRLEISVERRERRR